MDTYYRALLGELTHIPNILMLCIIIGGGFMYHRLNQLDKNFERRVQHATKKNYLMTLRLIIISNEVPVHEKLKHYDEYKRLGGNSWIDNYVERVLLTDPDINHPNRRSTDK